jgi:hypothetical protein
MESSPQRIKVALFQQFDKRDFNLGFNSNNFENIDIKFPNSKKVLIYFQINLESLIFQSLKKILNFVYTY